MELIEKLFPLITTIQLLSYVILQEWIEASLKKLYVLEFLIKLIKMKRLDGEELEFGGIPISKELIILTKKKGGEKLSITIKSEQLSGLFNNSMSLMDAVNQCKSEIAIVPLNDGEENEHFTEIRLAQVIEVVHSSIYNQENVLHYLSITLPVSFDSEKFKYANEINEWMKSAKVVLPTT